MHYQRDTLKLSLQGRFGPLSHTWYEMNLMEPIKTQLLVILLFISFFILSWHFLCFFINEWLLKHIHIFIVLINSWESKIIRSWTEEADSMNNVQALSNLNYFSWSIISNIEGNEMKWNYSLDVARNDGEGRRTCHWNQGYSDLKRRHCFRW